MSSFPALKLVPSVVDSASSRFESLMLQLTQPVHDPITAQTVETLREALKTLLKQKEGIIARELIGADRELLEQDDVRQRLRALLYYTDKPILGSGGIVSNFKMAGTMQADNWGRIHDADYKKPKVLKALEEDLTSFAGRVENFDISYLVTNFSSNDRGGYFFDHEGFQQVSGLDDEQIGLFLRVLNVCGIISGERRWFFCDPKLPLLSGSID